MSNSKIVYLKRKTSFSHEANAELLDWFGSASRGIGSYFVKGSPKPGTGLTFKEEEILMSIILNIPHTDRDFRKQVESYFHDVTTKVDADGRRLEIGLQSDNEKPVSEDNLPINIEDYIRYRHAKGHPQVALTEGDAKGNLLVSWWIDDPEWSSDEKIKDNARIDKALEKYLLIKGDPNKVERVLTNLGKDTRKIKEGEEVIELKKLAEHDPKTFVEVVENKNLETEYRITKLIQSNILNKVGTRILITESGDMVGRDMKEAVLWFDDATNSDTVGVLKARHQEFKSKSKKQE